MLPHRPRPLLLRLSLAGPLLLVWLLAPPALALDPNKSITQYVHDAWGTENGLPQSSVGAILQSRDGYLWVGTQEGIARFDGVAFTVFDKRTARGLSNSYVMVLLEDRQGNLWIGSRGGLTRLREGQFLTYTTHDGLSNDVVTSILEDRGGALWIGTYGGGLTRFQDGHFTTFGAKQGLSSEIVLSLREDGQGTLWIGTAGGLNQLKQGKLTSYSEGHRIEDVVLCIDDDRQGGLWLGTRGAGLKRLEGGKLTIYTTKDGLASNSISSIAQDRQGNVWIGTVGGGLSRFKDGRFETFTAREGLSNDFVKSIFEDREGSLWIGTEGGGLDRLRDGNFTTYSTAEGLSKDVALSILEDREGGLWIGTESGLNRFRNGRFTAYTSQQDLSRVAIPALLEDRDGSLWIGTYGAGLNRLKNGTLGRYTTRDGLSSDVVLSIYEDRSGVLWVGTAGGGLDRLKEGLFRAYTTKDGLSNNVILSILEDREGSLWIGTAGGGLDRLRDGRFTVYAKAQGLLNDHIVDLHEDRDGTLWIGTGGGGLVRFKDGVFTTYTTREGLADDVILRILDDERGNLWLSSEHGVFRVSREELGAFARGEARTISSVSYSKVDGMKSSECNGGSQPAGWRTRDGKLWFPTIKGVTVVDPAALTTNILPPPVTIESVMINKVAVDPKRSIHVPEGNGELEFHYTALSLLVPKAVKFKYRLEGFDRGWADAGARRVAYYTNIPPGRYRFRVIACNNDGLWNKAGAFLALYLEPHFYQTYWFYSLLVIASTLLAVGGHRLRVKQLKQRERQLIRLVEERTQELREVNQALEKRTGEVETANETLQRFSYMDALTSIPNRRFFDETLDRELRRTERAGTALSLILVDIDFFKAFNDAYGHQGGDECLKQVARVLNDGLHRAGDAVARYGGEEFGIILPGTALEGAVALATALRAKVESLGLRHERSAAANVVTISLGVATAVPGQSTSPEAIIAAADQELYRAKQDGRNRVKVFGAADTRKRSGP